MIFAKAYFRHYKSCFVRVERWLSFYSNKTSIIKLIFGSNPKLTILTAIDYHRMAIAQAANVRRLQLCATDLDVLCATLLVPPEHHAGLNPPLSEIALLA